MQISVFGCSILLVALILGYMHGTGKPATEVLNKSQGDGERVAPTPSKNTKTLGESFPCLRLQVSIYMVLDRLHVATKDYF